MKDVGEKYEVVMRVVVTVQKATEDGITIGAHLAPESEENFLITEFEMVDCTWAGDPI